LLHGGSGYFTCKENMKLVTTKFNLWVVLGCDSVWFGTLYQHFGRTDCIYF